MNKQTIMDEVVRIMNEAGISIDDNGMAEKNFIDNISSLTIISLFIRIENTFKIALPDQFIKIDTLRNITTLSDLILTLKNDSEDYGKNDL